MTEAFKKVMLSPFDRQALSDAALKKRVVRFFSTYRMREAMAATPGERGDKAREDFEAWKLKQKVDAVKKFGSSPRYHSPEEIAEVERKAREAQENKPDKDKWLESLNVNENPSALTIYGTGQFLAYMAVKEIMARQQEIKQKGISVLDKNGSALTPTIISALKTAAAMVLPFAPAPSAEDRKQMSKAAILLGLLPENIRESPDDYTAPAPNVIEIADEE